MPSQILQSVKKKIYAVCPEKMELSAGCVIKDHCGFGYTVWRVYPKIKIGQEWRQGVLTDVCQLDNIFGFEILGHPLGLSEVLRAIKGKIKFELWSVNTPGLLFVSEDNKSTVWNLLVNLDGQSEELWKFLDEIL